jgi:hypothetical protein
LLSSTPHPHQGDVPPVRPAPEPFFFETTDEPFEVLVPFAAYVEPPPGPKAKPRRARGSRMQDGLNRAVLRALAAMHYCLSGGCGTLKEAAKAYNSSEAYLRAVISLYLPSRWGAGSTIRERHALLDAALHGHVSLLTAAYRTNVATNITIRN